VSHRSPGQQGQAVERNFYKPFLNPGPRRAPNQSANKFADLYNMYYNTLSELCMNRFKWVGLPPTVDVRFVEQTLFRSALVVFYFEERYDQYMALRGTSAGNWNIYDNPTGFQVNGNSYVNRYVSARDAVPIWANYTRTPDTDIVAIYAQKFADLDLTLEINAHKARQSTIVFASENQKLSIQNLMAAIDRGDPWIPVKKNTLNPDDDLKPVDFGIDKDRLLNDHMLKSRLWGECMGLLGIDNANTDKRERVQAAEVNANDGQVSNMRRVNLNAREQAAAAINRRWPNLPSGPVSVSYHVDGDPVDEAGDAGGSLDLGNLPSKTLGAIGRG
jgi:hypothetical protein